MERLRLSGLRQQGGIIGGRGRRDGKNGEIIVLAGDFVKNGFVKNGLSGGAHVDKGALSRGRL